MDIDIDTVPSFNPLSIFPWVRSSVVRDQTLTPHPCGFHPQFIPKDFQTGLSAIPYDKAEDLGFMKLDFLHLHVYEHFNSRREIEQLLEVEPDWGILLLPEKQTKLFQLAKHGEILNAIRPKNIEELADVLALIRPGKSQYVKLYKSQKENTRRILYAKGEDGFSFKRSHAIAYAMVIVLQLHLMGAGII